MNSDFGHHLNLLLAMLRQNVGVQGVIIEGAMHDLPILSEDALTGSLGVDDGLEVLKRLCIAYPAECKLAAAQIEHATAAFGVEGDSTAEIIEASGQAAGALGTGIAAIVSAWGTKTTNTNTTNTSSNVSSSSSQASLGIYAGLSLGAAALLAVFLMRKK